jgi:hypothetical protein
MNDILFNTRCMTLKGMVCSINEMCLNHKNEVAFLCNQCLSERVHLLQICHMFRVQLNRHGTLLNTNKFIENK